MHSEDTKILDFNEYRKYDKKPVIIYAHVESLMWNIKQVKKKKKMLKVICDKSK